MKKKLAEFCLRLFLISQYAKTESLKVHLTSDFFIRLNECACFIDYILCEKIFGFG